MGYAGWMDAGWPGVWVGSWGAWVDVRTPAHVQAAAVARYLAPAQIQTKIVTSLVVVFLDFMAFTFIY